MKKRKALSAGNKIFLFLIQQMMAVIAAACITVTAVNSTVIVNGGNAKYNFFLNPFEYGDTPFEESDIFDAALETGIQDAIRMSVIKSQLETDGEFDANKEIDVTAYVKRAEQLSGSYVTAKYRLEDLLKWGKYGFEYTGKVFDSTEEMNAFLADATVYTRYEGTYTTGFHSKEESRKADGGKEPVQWAAATDEGAVSVSVLGGTEDTVTEYAETDAQSTMNEEAYYRIVEGAEGKTEREIEEYQQMLEDASADGETVVFKLEDGNYQSIMTNRYKTVDEKTPEELVSTWEEYYELCDNIADAASSLYYNYKEYLNYENSYSLENSNLIYCMEMLVGGENVYFTNAALKNYEEETIKTYFDSFGKYIYYSPYDMVYYTNTHVEEEYFLELMNSYNYAYNENTKIWIAVDNSYQAEDKFAKAEYAYNTFLPNWWVYVGGGLFCLASWLLLLTVQGVYAGRREKLPEGTGAEEDVESQVQSCATRFEMIPTEIWLFLCGIAAGLMILMVLFTYDVFTWKKMEYGMLVKTVIVETFLVSTVYSMVFYSMIRRWKVHNLWRGSFLYRLCGMLCRRVLHPFAGAVKTMYGNLPIVLRSLVPYCLFIGVNAAIGLAAVVMRNVLLLVALGVADAAVGWYFFKNSVDKKKIIDGIGEIRNGDLNYQVDTTKLTGENRILAEAVNSIGEGIRTAVETSMKDERLKADLITNVSHDIKTPLTSIINYVDLLKREDIQDEKVKNYIQVLDSKSQRLKQLTDDLVEASKISSGNITLHIERINIVELLNQAIGEFSEKFELKDLQLVVTFESKAMYIEADSRRMWRVIENLFNNIYKYALAGTRVYIDGKEEQEAGGTNVVFTVKNISEQPLNINADELTERFIRGDVSRSTEGSGLGLSIAKNLTEAQNGKFHIYLDGDLFKVMLVFRKAEERRD